MTDRNSKQFDVEYTTLSGLNSLQIVSGILEYEMRSQIFTPKNHVSFHLRIGKIKKDEIHAIGWNSEQHSILINS